MAAATVLQAAVLQWGASGLASTAPLWNGFAPEGTVPPFVVVTATLRTTGRQSEGVYVEAVTLAFEVVAAGADAADQIEQAIENAFDGWLPNVTGVNVMSVTRQGSGLSEDVARLPGGSQPAGRAPVKYRVLQSRVRPQPGP